MSPIPTLGRRGGGWVALQFLLLGLMAVVGLLDLSGWPIEVRGGLRGIGVLLVSAGTVLAVFAVTGLGASLTATPAPLPSATLRTGGIYARVRHPIYAALLLITLGWALISSPWCLVLVFLLALVLDLKRRVEEEFLTATYPGYAAYRAAVPAAFIPHLW
jgi:protein-S-isoprenylcysteine O-methyltransferase Ste14